MELHSSVHLTVIDQAELLYQDNRQWTKINANKLHPFHHKNSVDFSRILQVQGLSPGPSRRGHIQIFHGLYTYCSNHEQTGTTRGESDGRKVTPYIEWNQQYETIVRISHSLAAADIIIIFVVIYA